uniref:N-acetyltransferase domain-containing protein n=1 Tax=Oncorhynchus kisutch TaxID=8019 RepID=A0A8C7GWE7_ONCKI
TCSIREYQAEDKDAVITLFRNGILEHVYPAFFKTISHPDQIGVTLSISMAGYVLGGSSYFMALLFGGAWAGLIYYCCYEIYEGYRLSRMATDMADIQASFLDNPDNGFWVAKAEVNGKSKVAGLVAVIGQDERDGSYGEVPHLIVSFAYRKKGLGSQLAHKVMEFCKDRGFSRVVLETSSPQTAANALYTIQDNRLHGLKLKTRGYFTTVRRTDWLLSFTHFQQAIETGSLESKLVCSDSVKQSCN